MANEKMIQLWHKQPQNAVLFKSIKRQLYILHLQASIRGLKFIK